MKQFFIVYKKPFIYPLLLLFFPKNRWDHPNGIAITIGNTIYTNRIPDHRTLLHEVCHVKQQKGSALYAYCYYIPRYILSRKFRDRMENEAHAAEEAKT